MLISNKELIEVHDGVMSGCTSQPLKQIYSYILYKFNHLLCKYYFDCNIAILGSEKSLLTFF